ncbi:MAG: hypothetical protein L3K14_09970 [Thermoplasmata archaeon]|nr:hypothetical protein [Thermoplasmata archaeon]
MEDSVPRWRAVGLLGGLVTVEGLVLWGDLSGTSIGLPPAPANPGIVRIGGAFLLSLGGVTTILVGFTEEGVAFFGAETIGIAVDLVFPLSGAPAG